jgi:hypothetical protein
MKKLVGYIKIQIVGLIVLIGELRSNNKVIKPCKSCHKPYIFDHTNVSLDAIKQGLVVYYCDACDKKIVEDNIINSNNAI